MITSEQVSALIAAQQQRAYAMQNPQMLGMPAPVPGPSQYPPQFDFGVRGQGVMPVVGSNVAMAGIGAIPPAISGVGLMAGNVQGIGWMGHMAGIGAGTRLMNSGMLTGMSRLDPMSSMMLGAFTGGEAAWGMGAGAVARGALGGALGFGGLMNPVTLGAMGATFGIGQMHHGFTQQQGINSQLGGMQFINPGAQFGRGFSSANMMQFGNVMRSMDHADPFTTMRDMTGMLQRFNEMGMGQTSRDADEFTRKFKAMAETVRTLAKTMGTTIDEAAQTFGSLRQAGIYTARDVLGAGTQIRTLGSMGMGQDQALGLMQSGAGISRAMDMRGRAGSRAATGIAESLLTASQMGAFSGEELMDATGAPDVATASSQMALSMTSKLGAFLSSSSVGQAALATVGQKDASGRYTGHVDQGQLEGILSGQVGVKDLTGQGRSRLAGKAAGLSFTVKNRDIAAGLLEQDPMAVTGILMNSIRDRHPEMNEEDLFKFTMEHMVGLDRRETEVAAKMFKEYEATRRERNRKRMQEVAQALSDLDVKQYHTIEGWKQLVTGSVEDAFSPLHQFGAQMGTDFQRAGERFSDTVIGRTRFTSNEATRSAVLRDVMAGREQATSGTPRPSRLGVIPELSSSMGLAGAISANAGVASGDFSALEKEFANDPEAMRQIRAAAEYVRNSSSLRQAAIEKGEGGITTWDTTKVTAGMRMNGISFSGSLDGKERSATALAMHLAGYDGLGRQVAGLSGLTGSGGIASTLEEQQRQQTMAVLGSMSIKGAKENTRWWDSDATSGSTLAGRALDDLREGGGMNVIAAMQGKMTPQELREWEEKNKGLSPEDRAAALGEKLGVPGLTASSLKSAREFLKQTQGSGQKKMLETITGIEKSMQYSADTTNLVTIMGKAGAGAKYASKDFRALQTAATRAAMGDSSAGLGSAIDTYLTDVQGLSVEDLGELSGSGDFGSMVTQVAMRRKKLMGAHSVKDLKSMGVSDAELKELGVDKMDTLSSSQASEIATQISRRDLVSSVQSSGGIYTGSTESTQVQLQLAQQMTTLVDSNRKFVETVNTLVATQKGTTTSLGANNPATKPVVTPEPPGHL